MVCGTVQWCGMVWSHEVCCGVLRCHVMWFGVMCCGLMSCAVVCCAQRAVTKTQRPGGLPTGTSKRLGLCVFCARCVCTHFGAKRGSRGNLVVAPQATILTPRAPAVPLLSPLVGASAASAMPAPSCCPDPGGPSAMWPAPWSGRTRPVWTPR